MWPALLRARRDGDLRQSGALKRWQRPRAHPLEQPGAGGPDDWRKEIQFWKDAGVTHATVHTTYVSNHHKRIAGKTYAEHLDAVTRYKQAVEDLI